MCDPGKHNNDVIERYSNICNGSNRDLRSDKKLEPCLNSEEAPSSDKEVLPCHNFEEEKLEPFWSSKEVKLEPCPNSEEEKPDPCSSSEEENPDPCSSSEEENPEPCSSSEEGKPEPCLSSDEELDDEESSVTSLSSCSSSSESSVFGGFSVEEGGVPLQSACDYKTWTQCFKCKEIFGTQAECLLHSAVCGAAALKCCQCDYKTQDKDALEKHHEEEHTEDVIQKDIKTRGRKPKNSKLVRHLCPKCPRTFKHEPQLNYHLRKECGRPPRFHCTQCGYRCDQKAKMRLHQEHVHNQLSDSFVQLQRAAAATVQLKSAAVDTINNNQSGTCPSTP